MRAGRRTAGTLACALLAVAAAGPAWGQGDELPPGEGRDLVQGLCAACHSIGMVTQQGMDRERWDDTLDWMVEKQGMPEQSEENREMILDYLAEHFGEETGDGQGGMSPWNN